MFVHGWCCFGSHLQLPVLGGHYNPREGGRRRSGRRFRYAPSFCLSGRFQLRSFYRQKFTLPPPAGHSLSGDTVGPDFRETSKGLWQIVFSTALCVVRTHPMARRCLQIQPRALLPGPRAPSPVAQSLCPTQRPFFLSACARLNVLPCALHIPTKPSGRIAPRAKSRQKNRACHQYQNPPHRLFLISLHRYPV